MINTSKFYSKSLFLLVLYAGFAPFYVIAHFRPLRNSARLRKLLCSPFFNENKEIISLFDELKTNYLNDEAVKIEEAEKTAIWLNIKTDKETFDDLKFRRLCSELLKFCEAFLVYARTSFTNFARYLKRISNLNRLDRKATEKLRKLIEANAILADKQWLLA